MVTSAMLARQITFHYPPNQANSFVPTLLRTLCYSAKSHLLCFQVNPHSLRKTPGVRGTRRDLQAFGRSSLRAFQPRKPFPSYHIPANPAVSCNYTLFCATGIRYRPCFQQIPHSFADDRGGTPLQTRQTKVRRRMLHTFAARVFNINFSIALANPSSSFVEVT